MSHPSRSRRAVRQGVSTFALLLCVAASAALAQPTVNGLYFGDGDDALYQYYATSDNGSVLYSYLDVPTKTLYVALVVSHAVNTLVCSPKGNSAYTSSDGWSQHRSCKRASDSEFAAFTLECAPGSANAWSWQQALGCAQTAGPPPSNWVSAASCPSSAGIWPPSIVASSSWVANVNTYQANGTPAWNLYAFGTDLDGGWKSPFLASSPDNVTLVPGYPTYSGGNYLWEWSMVYEWSVNLGPSGTDCGNDPVYFITGQSHHSPPKCAGCDNDTFEPPEDPVFSDWGDVPNSYGTTEASNGARHYITVNGPYLGLDIQAETDGQPTTDATGDGSEEDGVTANVTSNWTAGSSQSFEITVSNAPSGALLGAWIDWNGDGDFADAGEYFTASVTNGTNTLNVTVGSGFDWQSDTLYARFRIFSSGATAPGGSLTQADFVGTATDGEVEDYVFGPGDLPVTLNAFSSEGTPGGELTVRWQTASETDNVAFELWGLVAGQWQPLTDLIQSRNGSSGLAQSYEARIAAPPGLTAVQLLDYDSRGRLERFGSYRLGESYGELQPVRPIDWTGPRAERAERLRELGFA
ncbi:MAG TPA: GEVED domain-containing protein, partial [Thermoanaerobaculia bacterium]|nr:GEVED domain-containing protein [Thermoanaerobaculia bacterium]